MDFPLRPLTNTTSSRVSKKTLKKITNSDFSTDSAEDAVSESFFTSSPLPLPSVIDSFFLSLKNEDSAKKMLLEHGETLLHHLEQLRLHVLTGVVPYRQLEELNDLLQRKKIESSDNALSDIIQDLETRVAVELAKLNRE